METHEADGSKDMLYLVGGLALLIAGAGLIMAHPAVRRQVRNGLDRVVPGIPENFSSSLATLAPDVQRYLKIRSM